MLHIVNKSPTQTRSLESCLRMVMPEHAVLLIEDGVYAAIAGTPLETKVRAASINVKFFALKLTKNIAGAFFENIGKGI